MEIQCKTHDILVLYRWSGLCDAQDWPSPEHSFRKELPGACSWHKENYDRMSQALIVPSLDWYHSGRRGIDSHPQDGQYPCQEAGQDGYCKPEIVGLG